MRRFLQIVLVFAALAALAVVQAARREVPRFETSGASLPRGVFHSHGEDSHDSRTTLEQVVEVARKRELDFVVLTDHNSQLDEPRETKGVIVLSYAELSTDFGHVVQLGARNVPSSKEREKITVLSGIRERGGVPILSHPFDSRIPWRGSTTEAGGLEIVNVSTTARRRAGGAFIGLLPSLLVYGFHSDLALAQLYDRDEEALALWDGEPDPRFVGLCAVDSHGKMDLEDNMSLWETVLEDDLPREKESRPGAILEALRTGRFHCRGGLFGRPSFALLARSIDGMIHKQGSSVDASAIEELSVRGPVPVEGGQEPTLVLLRDGGEVTRVKGTSLTLTSPDPGTYRAEARVSMPNPFFGHRDATVLYSNRIRLLPAPGSPENQTLRTSDGQTTRTP